MSNPHRFFRLLLLYTTVASISACATASVSSQPPMSLAPLLETVGERLTIADQVALTKWDNGKPVQDSPREQQVIANAAKLAPVYKLDAEDVSQLLAAQIEANKLVQYALLSQWNIQGKAPNSPRPDLTNDIRPKLDQIQIKLLERYAAFVPYRDNPSCQPWLARAIQDMSNDKTHTLALVRATGEICIAKPHS